MPGSTASAPERIWPAKYHPPPAKNTSARATTTASTDHSSRRSQRRGRLVAGAPGGDPDDGRTSELDITRLRPCCA